MKKFIDTLGLLLLFLTTYSAIGAEKQKNFTVKNFSNIVVSSGIDLYLTQGNTENLLAKADASIIDAVIVEQQGDQVVIKIKDNIKWTNIFKNKSVKVYVNFRNLKSISASGGSDVYTENQIKSDKLSIMASGGSDLKIDLNCKNLELQISGGSDADLKGRAENMDVKASGGSALNGFNLLTEYAKVYVSGGSDANVNVNKGIEAGANGGSDIHFKGNAALKKMSSSNSGDIIRVK